MSRVLRIILVLAALMAIAAMPAAAGSSPKLHPSGFGKHSYAAWKGGEGLEDSTGNKDQALYFQKHTSTTTFAAGVAVFIGFSGQTASSLLPLSFWYRADGHCGAGAPRFNVQVEGEPIPRFIGCAGMLSTDTRIQDGYTWIQKTYSGPFLTDGRVVSVAIVFDEGDDVGEGFVYLDDITVGGYTWTSASDNGGGNSEVDSATLEAMWGAPLETLLMP
jgi:hypothetical protein